jgi:hypothetical protein
MIRLIPMWISCNVQDVNLCCGGVVVMVVEVVVVMVAVAAGAVAAAGANCSSSCYGNQSICLLGW